MCINREYYFLAFNYIYACLGLSIECFTTYWNMCQICSIIQHASQDVAVVNASVVWTGNRLRVPTIQRLLPYNKELKIN